ncbi:MAG: multidrug effflux MFS transporter [Rhodospirillales bacterium]|nr:multidrug effflux MFS transporter [Rhodospirillales bacterium]
MSSLTPVTPDGRPTAALVPLLASLAAVGQFACNIYIPSLPGIAVALAQPMPAVQMTLAAFFAMFALGQLICGPLSDRYGRRPVLIVGMLTFLIGTAVCAASTDLGTLIAGRIIQGGGAAAAFVISRAMTRDLFSGTDLTRVMALISIAFALVPGLTPLVGGLLNEVGGWRSTFAAALAFGLVVFVCTLRLTETNHARTSRIDVHAIRRAYMEVLGTRAFLRFALPSALVFAGMSAFFAGSPDVFINRLGISPIEYGLYPPLSIIGFVLGGLATRRLASTRSQPEVAGVGLGFIVLAGVAIAGFPAAGVVHKHAFNGCMIVFVTGLGIFLPTAVAAALSPFARIAGSAAAVLGFLQMAGGALGTIAVSALIASLPVMAFPLVMAATGLGAGLLFIALRRSATEGARLSADGAVPSVVTVVGPPAGE